MLPAQVVCPQVGFPFMKGYTVCRNARQFGQRF
jgi:hypothetical protein